jgi:hypothetical protein
MTGKPHTEELLPTDTVPHTERPTTNSEPSLNAVTGLD